MTDNRTRIFRNSKTKNYSIISNEVIRRDDISWKAKGIMCYILSLPDDWAIYLEEVAKHSTDGMRSFRSGWKELKEKGYVRRYPVYKNGKISEWQTEIVENVDIEPSPLLCQNVHVENVDVQNVDVQNDKLLSTYITNDLSILNTDSSNIVGQEPPNKVEPIPYKSILDYLNEKTGRNFRNVEANKKLIRARWNEGYRQDDFEKVIDNMMTNWQNEIFSNGIKAKTYLQPSTLFSGNFDKYLNQIPMKKGNSNKPPMVEVPEYAQLLEGMDFSHKIIDENVSEDDFIY